MNILLPTRWQKQPQTPVEIDWNHPLAKGLTGLWIFNQDFPINLVNGYKASASVSPTRDVSINGKGRRSASMLLAPDVSKLINGASGAMLYYGVGDETGGSGKNFLSAGVSSVFTGIYSGASLLSFAWNSGGITSSSSISRSGNKKIVLTSSASARKVFNQGVLIETLSAGSSTTNTSGLYLGFETGSLPASSFANIIATWNRTLTDKEAAEASRNIYQVLRPQKHIFAFADLNTTFDFDLPLPSLDLSADMVLVEEGQQFFDLSLPLPTLDISASMIKGEAIDLGLTLNAPDLFMDIGVVNRFSLSLPLPKVDFALTAFVGSTIDNIDLVVPTISFGGDLSNGAVLSLDLPLPSIDIDLSFGEVLSLELPALDFSASMATGSVMALNLPMPSVDLSASLNTSNAFAVALELPAIDIALSAMTGNVIAIDLPIDMPVIQGQLLAGNAMSLMLDIELDADLSLASSLMMDIDLDLPSLLFDAVMYGAQTRSGRFYNRWTR